jgi:hypothetical protein
VNRIIIKEIQALGAAAQKTSAFCTRSPENNPLADGIKTAVHGPADQKLLLEKDFLLFKQNAAPD